MHRHRNHPADHVQRLHKGEAPAGAGVGALGQEEPGVPGDRDDLVPVGEQGVSDGGVMTIIGKDGLLDVCEGSPVPAASRTSIWLVYISE